MGQEGKNFLAVERGEFWFHVFISANEKAALIYDVCDVILWREKLSHKLNIKCTVALPVYFFKICQSQTEKLLDNEFK